MELHGTRSSAVGAAVAVLTAGLLTAGLLTPVAVSAAVAPHDARADDRVLRLRPVPGSDLRSLDVPLTTIPGVSARGSEERVATGPLRTTGFSLLGLTWSGAREPRIRVRTLADGQWTRWQSVPLLHDLPDPGAEGRASLHATAPWWVGRSTGVDVRVDARGDGDVAGLTLALIDPGRGATTEVASGRRTTQQGPAARKPKPHRPKAAPRPRIHTRKQWDANERWRNGGPWYNRTIKQVHVHHTATGNDYSRKDVPALLRSIYRYHTKNLGWSDIGYNFVIDRFGRIWQGRAGGIGRPVRGAHTLGFNHNSTGVSVLGTFTDKVPARRVRTALVRLAAWRLDHYGRRPAGRVTVRSHGSDKYSSGTRVRLRVIDGHRDTNDTECPGFRLYARLANIRDRAQERDERFDPRP